MLRLRRRIDRRAKSESERRGMRWLAVPRRPWPSEYLDGAFQRLPHAPDQGYADKGPEQRGPGVEPAEPDAVGTRRTRCPGAHRRCLQLGDVGIAHVPFFIDRLD